MAATATARPQDTSPTIDGCPTDDRLWVKWLEGRPASEQKALAEDKLKNFFEDACQPRHASGNACIKLCYFIEQCRKSSCSLVQDVVLSKSTALQLFDFYVEWNEKNQNRSMRQVLELLSSLVSRNQEKPISDSIKATILQRTLSVITHESVQPLVKPSFKSLECLLGKNAISPDELSIAYEAYVSQKSYSFPAGYLRASTSTWNTLVSAFFYWLGPADVAPAAGKFLVTLFKALRQGSVPGNPESHSGIWQQWICQGLSKRPQSLENVKNYLLTPLFKLDRPGSLALLRDLNQHKAISDVRGKDIDSYAMLQLAAIDAGKKSGLVEEPSKKERLQRSISLISKDLGTFRPKATQSRKGTESIPLDEEAIGSLLGNSSNTVRSLAFSVLVTSFSSTRPFNPAVLDLLSLHLRMFHSDTDAKFRNEVLSNTKHMIERLRGATALLAREIEQTSYKLAHADQVDPGLKASEQAVHDTANALFRKHKSFVEWYMDFLFGELIPTASYQRHITALRAVNLVLRSRLQEEGQWNVLPAAPSNTPVWPFALQFFDPRSMRLLLDLLMDPFEDVRSSAADILALSPPSHFAILSPPSCKSNNGEDVSDTGKEIGGDTGSEYLEGNLLNKSTRSQPLALLMDFISKADEASKQSGRADYADGVARSYKLLHSLQPSIEARMELIEKLVNDLESKVVLAERNLGQAVQEAPVHGNFAALCFISADFMQSLGQSPDSRLAQWEHWGKLQLLMVSLSSRIWEAVQEILCNDSPEGHLPQEVGEVDDIDTKDVLSYSFRAIHESSNLTKIIANNLKCKWPENLANLVTSTFVHIGNLAFTQLSTLRHRGAFSTVALTFARCCQLTQDSNLQAYSNISRTVSTLSATTRFSSTDPIPELLQAWWEGTLTCISTQASTTRRSAGIPKLVTGIMTANAECPSIEETIIILVETARAPVIADGHNSSNREELPQVHAMNSLREAFKTASVRNRLDKHVVKCLSLAADSFSSETWAIKNCGLLLFQTLVDYVLGTETREEIEVGWLGDGTKIDFDKYPALWGKLVHLLEVSAKTQTSIPSTTFELVEKTFPVLDILRRAGPPPTALLIARSLVESHLGSPVWQVRELAARTMCALSPANEWQAMIEQLAKFLRDSTNRQHGALLAMRFLFEEQLKPDRRSNSYHVTDLCHLFTRYFSGDNLNIRSQAVLAAHLEAGNSLIKVILMRISSEASGTFAGVTESLDQMTTKSEPSYLDSDAVAQTFKQNAFIEFGKLTEYCPSPTDLAHIGAIRRAVYITALQHDKTTLKEILSYAVRKGEGAALAAVAAARGSWRCYNSEDDPQALFRLFSRIMFSPSQPSVRVAVIDYLINLLEEIEDYNIAGILAETVKIGELGSGDKNNTELNNAWIRFTGLPLHMKCLMEKDHGPSANLQHELKRWGVAMVRCLDDENGFDRRYSAVHSILSFFNRSLGSNILSHECLVPSLLATCKALNDDDEQIRLDAALIVTKLTGKSLAPPKATDELLFWTIEQFPMSNLLAQNVAMRLLGSLLCVVNMQNEIPEIDAETDFEKSLARDNDLFAVESTNLWVDPVTEASRWRRTFLYLTKESVEQFDGPERLSPLRRLVVYSTKGLEVLNMLTSKQDGAFGWSSKPAAFAVCARVLLCVNAIFSHLRVQGSPIEGTTDTHLLAPELRNILGLLDIFIRQGFSSELNGELMMILLGPETLAATRLDVLLPGCVQGIIDAAPFLRGPQLRLSRNS